MDFAVVQGFEFHHLRLALTGKWITTVTSLGWKIYNSGHLVGRSGSHTQLEEIAIEIFILGMGGMGSAEKHTRHVHHQELTLPSTSS